MDRAIPLRLSRWSPFPRSGLSLPFLRATGRRRTRNRQDGLRPL